MAPNPTLKGYQEEDYLTTPYLTGTGYQATGFQVKLVIASSQTKGFEVARQIVDSPKPVALEALRVVADAPHETGLEANLVVTADETVGFEAHRITALGHAEGVEAQRQIVDYAKPIGLETSRQVDSGKTLGVETLRNIVNFPKPSGIEVKRIIADFPKATAVEVRRDKSFPHIACEDAGYLMEGYLTDPYLGPSYCVHGPIEALRTIKDFTKASGFEIQRVIKDTLKPFGFETLRTIKDTTYPVGFEVKRFNATSLGFQARFVIYNATLLRVLSDFASRGAVSGVGNNAWGNPVAGGENWTATSTAAGDFSPFNLNTDIVEQAWRSNGATSATLSCDTEIAQGTTIDTLAMLGHNLTTSAVVVLEGSDDPGFSPVEATIGLTSTRNNLYYIAPTFPTAQHRYWRIVISDPTNPAGYLQVGTIVFGNAQITSQPVITEEIRRTLKHFADKVQTEGFTNVTNDRAVKTAIGMQAPMVPYSGGNYRLLRDIFESARTSVKCLWIPDPTKVDRFTVFAKLVQIPVEQHVNRGDAADLVTFSIELDESL